MSLAAEAKIKELMKRVEQLETALADVMSILAAGKPNGATPPEPSDKRTNAWKEWNEKHGHARA